jgi:selenocysteine lyase/cysteine desulfurase
MCLKDLCVKKGLKLLELELKFPLTTKNVLFQLEKFLEGNKEKIRFSLFEHISSPTAILFPIKEMIQLCHKYDIMVTSNAKQGFT